MNLNDLLQLSTAERIAELERRDQPATTGDFVGSVNASWVRLDESGAGVVSYNDKEYYTKRIGFTSIPAGTDVELSYANGVYYSKW